MIKDTDINTDDSGKRDPANDRKRLLFGVLLLLLMAVIELTLGQQIEEQHLTNGKTGPGELSIVSAVTVPGDVTPRKKRILYISNSHAKTGGQVVNHLQSLLNKLQPGAYEVTDMAAPGIFAPDMLQRMLQGLKEKPDLVIMAVAYISFSDRMKLALQSHSARSFFKPDVFDQLSFNFWLRNYDIGLYLETFLQQHLRIFRYRNSLRNLWELPVTRTLKTHVDNRSILFLAFEQNQRWRFPDGYDRNLFDWRLYSAGRQGHLADLEEAINTAARNEVPVIGVNLPVHWEKSVRGHDAEDYQLYRKELTDLFAETLDYVDYQDQFPVQFTTYDALHPTWHGARLHALDLVLRMHRQHLVEDARTPAEISEIFTTTDAAVSTQYRESLSGPYKALEKGWFRRYDIFEPNNAHMLMRHLASLPVGSQQESEHLFQLSLRLRYWQETEFNVPSADPDAAYADVFNMAANAEIENARKRADYFQQQLVEFQSSRLNIAPLPDLDTATKLDTNVLSANLMMPVSQTRYQLDEEKHAVSIDFINGRAIARGIVDNEQHFDYLRVDILGDLSFLLIQKTTGQMIIPTWALHIKPFVQFGI